MKKTPLEDWIAAKIGLGLEPITREAIEKYQLVQIRQTIDFVVKNSRFYQKKLKGVNAQGINSFEQFAKLPFTYPDDIRKDPLRFVCISPTEIERIVSLQSSGTSGPPKRIYFTKEDQELTIDFFNYGMRNLVGPKDRVMILLPWQSPGSVGDLLQIGLKRMNVHPILYGPVFDGGEAIEKSVEDQATSMVGIPTHVLAMARHKKGHLLKGRIKSVLLSTDYVPASVCRVLEDAWGCKVFNHYGMTETGLGGGVQCSARVGYHLREADLYFEIVDPETGVRLPAGQAGEVVFTTLTRKGMPLLRYRTGDISRFVPKACPCGTVLRSMDLIKNRTAGIIQLGDERFSLPDLDEKLFALEGILDFTAELKEMNGEKFLYLDLKTQDSLDINLSQALETLLTIPAIRTLYPKKLTIYLSQNRKQVVVSKGTVKRKIVRV